MPSEELIDQLNSYVKEGKAIRRQIAEICIYSEGAIDYNTAWGLSFDDREQLIKTMNKRAKEMNPKGKEYM